MEVSNLLRNNKTTSISTFSQGKVSMLMRKWNKIEQCIKRLHSLIRFALEKILETHFLMPSRPQYSRHIFCYPFFKKQLKLANLVLEHRIGYLTKAHQTAFLSCSGKCLIDPRTYLHPIPSPVLLWSRYKANGLLPLLEMWHWLAQTLENLFLICSFTGRYLLWRCKSKRTMVLTFCDGQSRKIGPP